MKECLLGIRKYIRTQEKKKYDDLQDYELVEKSDHLPLVDCEEEPLELPIYLYLQSVPQESPTSPVRKVVKTTPVKPKPVDSP